MMKFTAKQISDFLQGRVEGDETVEVNTFAKIEEGKEGSISFLSNPKYTHYIYDTASSIVLVDESLTLEKQPKATLIRVKNAYECIAKLLQFYDSMKPRKTGIDPQAFVASSAKIGKDCYVGAFAYIGDDVELGDGCQVYPHAVIYDHAKLGSQCLVYPHVRIYHGCILGSRVIVHSGAVIGADGFGFVPNADGYDKIPQIGIVTIEDDVEIGANTCIDRSTMGSTYVRRGVKLDNLIQLAHNVEVGANTVMAAQAGVAGSSKVGEWCMFGGQVGVAGHVSIADKTQIGAQAGIAHSIRPGSAPLIGSPAFEAREYFKSYAVFRKLPELYAQINELQKQLEEFKREENIKNI